MGVHQADQNRFLYECVHSKAMKRFGFNYPFRNRFLYNFVHMQQCIPRVLIALYETILLQLCPTKAVTSLRYHPADRHRFWYNFVHPKLWLIRGLISTDSCTICSHAATNIRVKKQIHFCTTKFTQAVTRLGFNHPDETRFFYNFVHMQLLIIRVMK